MEKDKIVFLILDCGSYAGISECLSEGGKHKVYYHTSWSAKAFPVLQDFAPGTGYENLIKIKHLYKEIDFHAEGQPIHVKSGDKIDCVICFDVNRNDELIDIKKDYPSLSCVGSGEGEIIEEDREGLKKICESFGLDVQPYVIKHGIDELEEYAKTHNDIYAKIDIFRQSMETIHIEDYKSSVLEDQFTDLRKEFGPVFSKKIKFIVEDAIQSDIEIGMDGFTCPGYGYLNKFFLGYEYKKMPYICKVCDVEDMPEPIYETMEAFEPLLEKLDYCGYVSTEEKLMPDGRHFMLDWCSRLLSPGSALYPYAIKKWGEFNYRLGKRDPMEIETEFKYYGTLPSMCKDGANKYIWIKADPKYKDNIRFMNVCSDGENYFSVKGDELMCVLVAGADSWQEVIEKLKGLMDYIDYDGIDKNVVNYLQAYPKLIADGKGLGIDF